MTTVSRRGFAVEADGVIEHLVDLTASAIEVLAVVIIGLAVAFGTARFLLQWQGGRSDSYERYKNHLGRACC
jgi:hypothetical protein